MLATAYTLAQGIRAAGGADLVICGKQTTDGDTAQVGAELAEFLGIPHVAGVSRIHELSDEEILLDLDLPLHVKTVRVKLPCLVCVEKGIYEPRLPSFRRKLETAGRPVRTFTLDDMEDPAPEPLRALRLPDPGKTDFSARKIRIRTKAGRAPAMSSRNASAAFSTTGNSCSS